MAQTKNQKKSEHPHHTNSFSFALSRPSDQSVPPFLHAMDKTVRTAVIIQPPKELWDQIQEIRSKYDKAFQRWMPHVNLLYPFLQFAQLKGASARVTSGVAQISPFQVSLHRFGFFTHANSNTVYLHPEVLSFKQLLCVVCLLFYEFFTMFMILLEFFPCFYGYNTFVLFIYFLFIFDCVWCVWVVCILYKYKKLNNINIMYKNITFNKLILKYKKISINIKFMNCFTAS